MIFIVFNGAMHVISRRNLSLAVKIADVLSKSLDSLLMNKSHDGCIKLTSLLVADALHELKVQFKRITPYIFYSSAGALAARLGLLPVASDRKSGLKTKSVIYMCREECLDTVSDLLDEAWLTVGRVARDLASKCGGKMLSFHEVREVLRSSLGKDPSKNHVLWTLGYLYAHVRKIV